MAMDVIEAIKKVEKQAEEHKKNAFVQAEALIAEAHVEGKRTVSEAIDLANEKAKGEIEIAKQKAAEAYDRIGQEYERQTAEVLQGAELNVEGAIEAVIAEILG